VNWDALIAASGSSSNTDILQLCDPLRGGEAEIGSLLAETQTPEALFRDLRYDPAAAAWTRYTTRQQERLRIWKQHPR